ncbi:MAG: ABC transporter substrate-binding protein [Acutalibacteraceae bacterium]|nr:ABC transporter substrate-binding protein [Acutalibacteraceae bacterium]
MKKIISLVMVLVLCVGSCFMLSSCGESADYTVGICQLMKHESLDKATKGFMDALKEALEAEGKTVKFDEQVPGDPTLCTTVVNTFVSKKVDLIMGNATPCLLAAANATTTIPVLGTSVTDYTDTFAGKIPANVTGTSDAVPFDRQAQMMIDTLGLKEGDKVGVIFCTNESNSLLQYNAVKAYFDTKGIVTTPYTFSDTTEIQTVAGNAAANSKAIYIPSDNTVADNDSIVGTICNDKKIPVYTSYGGSICYASLAIDYYRLGVETGKMAAEILLGNKTPEDFEIKTLEPSASFNKDLCNTLGITVTE